MFAGTIRADKPHQSLEVEKQKNRKRELVWLSLVLLAGLLPRLLFFTFFPTQPVSDFLNLLNFAIKLRENIFASGSILWNFFNVGTPFLLSLFLRLTPLSPPAAARTITVLGMGLLPLFPFLLWKHVFTLRTRVLTALLLAFWPGLIIFSGVFAQDNWVLLPVVGLSVLSVRVLVKRSSGHPIWASILYVAGVAIRQEMMIVLFPMLIISVVGYRPRQRARNALVGVMTTGLLLSLMVVQRGIGSGRYALSTSHLDVSILGSYVPGAGVGWVDPKPFIAATAPELFENDQYKEEALHLVWKEVLRRPRFHLIRIFADPFYNLFEMEPGLAYWSLTAPDVLPTNRQEAAQWFTQEISAKLIYLSYLLHIIFLSSVFFSFGLFILRRGSLFLLILPLLTALLLKLAFHAVIVSQPRYFLTVIVLEILIIGIVSSEIFNHHHRKSAIISLLLGIAAFAAIASLSTKAVQFVLTNDENYQRTYQFPLSGADMRFNCMVKRGRLLTFIDSKAGNEGLIIIDFQKADPRPGSRATVECSTVNDHKRTFELYVYDPYLPGGLQNKIIQVVYLNDVEVYNHDIAAEPGEGWHKIDLSSVDYDDHIAIKVELRAMQPDVGWNWGRAAATRILIRHPTP